MTTFSETMWQEIQPLYRGILDLPFNRELAAGTLSRETFLHYMIQDAHYLAVFARALAVGAAKAPTAAAQAELAGAAREAIVVERALHQDFFAAFDVTSERFEAAVPSPVCSGYADFLLATAYGQPFAVAVAAILPCFHIYEEVGRALLARAAVANPFQKWIDTYADESFAIAVRMVRGIADEAFGVAAGGEQRLMRDVYWKASRYEWMFWDSAYRREGWPV